MQNETDEAIIELLGFVECCWFRRITRQHFKNRVWTQLKSKINTIEGKLNSASVQSHSKDLHYKVCAWGIFYLNRTIKPKITIVLSLKLQKCTLSNRLQILVDKLRGVISCFTCLSPRD